MPRIPFPQLYTLRDLAERSRLPRSVLQRWGNIGVLLAEEPSVHGGRGVHRRFQASEMVIAILLRPFSALDVPSGQLLRMATTFRRALRSIGPGAVRGVHYHEGDPELRRAMLHGAYGTGTSYLVLGLTTGEIPFAVFSETDAAAPWRGFFDVEPRPEAVVIIDLAILHGVMGEQPLRSQ